MSYIKEIFKNELKNNFTSPTIYIVLGFFLLLTGWFFSNPLFINNQANLRILFKIVPLIFIVFIPAITMGLISKEKNTSTLEILMTLPIKNSEIILGKFLSAVSTIVIGLSLTFIHVITISFLAQNSVDFGQIFCGYLGLIFIGSIYSAAGIFASTLSKNQIVSFIIALAIILFFFLIGKILFFLPANLSPVFQFLSIDYHMENFSKGVIDTRNLIYFGSLITLFLKLADLNLKGLKR